MNKITLDKIEKNEVLRYLGCSNESSLDENILDEIDSWTEGVFIKEVLLSMHGI